MARGKYEGVEKYMRNRVFGLLAAIGIALGVMAAGGTPALADSTKVVDVHFHNEGLYWAYADIEAYDSANRQVWSDASGSFGHTGHKTFFVPAGVAWIHWKVRMEPFGNTIHEQSLGWDNFNDRCPDGKHATIFVGGTAGDTDDYDMHCSNWS